MEVIIEGYLEKKARFRNVWRPMYFVLCKNGILTYATSASACQNTQNSKRLKVEKMFPFVDGLQHSTSSALLSGHHSSSTGDSLVSGGRRFNIKCEDRTIQLKATNANEKQAWHDSLVSLDSDVCFDRVEEKKNYADMKQTVIHDDIHEQDEKHKHDTKINNNNQTNNNRTSNSNNSNNNSNTKKKRKSSINNKHKPTNNVTISLFSSITHGLFIFIMYGLIMLANYVVGTYYYVKWANSDQNVPDWWLWGQIIGVSIFQLIFLWLSWSTIRLLGYCPGRNNSFNQDEYAISGSNGDVDHDLSQLLAEISTTNTTTNTKDAEEKKSNQNNNTNNTSKIHPKLVTILDNARIELLSLAENADDFIFLHNTNGISIYSKPPLDEFCLPIFKGEGIVHASPATVCSFLFDPQRKSQYDNMFDPRSRILLDIDGNTRVAHHMYKSVPFVTPRDFCLLTQRIQLDDDTWMIVAKSIISDLCPPIDSHIRGETLIGGFLIQQVQQGSKVTFIGSTNLKGSLPKRLKMMVGQRQPMIIERINAMISALDCQ